jgi:hypothetical protein
MKPGVRISVVYNDEYVLKLRVYASNGVFAGQADVYADSDTLAAVADALKGFPDRREDTREFELGTFDEDYAGGGAGFRFFCVDSVGHALAQVRLQADSRTEADVNDAATLHVPVVAAAVDSFVEGLARIAANTAESAVLDAAS